VGKKRGRAGKITPAEARKDLLRLFKVMLDKFGILPDAFKNQSLALYLQVSYATEDTALPMSYPEEADFT
jgi:hypothetical protein